MQDPESKILTLNQAFEWRREIACAEKKLVFTNGCFDLIHRGHIEYLVDARMKGDALVVALNSDKSVRMLKGAMRPLVSEVDRAFHIASFLFVDAVVIFNEKTCVELIKRLSPDVYVKGGDYNMDNIDKGEKKALDDCGARIEFIKFIGNYSTTAMIEKIKKFT